jgi:hypothetical protein
MLLSCLDLIRITWEWQSAITGTDWFNFLNELRRGIPVVVGNNILARTIFFGAPAPRDIAEWPMGRIDES